MSSRSYDRSTAELEADLRQLRRDLTEAERQRDAATREADHRQREAEQLRAHAAAQAQHLAEARAQIEDLRRALERADAVHAKKVTLAEGVGELAALVLTNHIARAFQAVGPERCEELRLCGVVPGFVLHVEYKAYRLRDLPAPDAAARRRYVDAYWHYRRSGTTPIAVIVSFPDGAKGTSILGWGTRSENAPPELTTPTQEPPAQEASP